MMISSAFPLVMTTAAIVGFASVTVNSSANMALVYNANDSGAIAIDAQGFAAKAANLNKLDAMASFSEDWNGYGAKGFSKEIIESSKRIIAHLPKQPEIFPTGRGTVQMEYHRQDGTYLEFEVCQNKVTVLFIDRGNMATAEENELRLDDYAAMAKYVNGLG